jgi:hypothetical protein
MTRKAFGLAGIAASLLVAPLAALVAAHLSAPALAHHAFAIFDQTRLLHVTGAVKDFELVNPHGWLHLTITNDKGTTTWSFEGGSVKQLTSLGFSKDAFRVGDKVDVGYHPMKDGSRGGQLMSVTLTSGQKLCSNRGCGDGTGEVLAPF